MYSIFYYSYQYHYYLFFFFFNDTATTEIYTLSLHDALPICRSRGPLRNDQSPPGYLSVVENVIFLSETKCAWEIPMFRRLSVRIAFRIEAVIGVELCAGG